MGGGVFPVRGIFKPDGDGVSDPEGPRGLFDDDDETLERPDEPTDIMLGTLNPCLLSCFPLRRV